LPVFVLNSLSKVPPTDCPEIIKQKYITLIYLSTGDKYWSQYAYQFSHELCHYVIYTDFPPINDRFGFLEEALCELASLYTLNKMNITWQTNPPYSNWRNYSDSLKKYVDDVLSKPENNIAIPFAAWLTNNLPKLYKDRYGRTENRIIAIQLLPIFAKTPELWEIIHFINGIIITNDMTLKQYLSEWRKLVPPNLYSSFDSIVAILASN
jgi:hypothetical protein